MEMTVLTGLTRKDGFYSFTVMYSWPDRTVDGGNAISPDSVIISSGKRPQMTSKDNLPGKRGTQDDKKMGISF